LQPVEPAHIAELCRQLRGRERAALLALGRSDAETLLAHEVARSCRSFAGTFAGEVLAIGGARALNLLSDEAYLWLICTEAALRHPVAFARGTLTGIAAINRQFPRLYGVVFADFSRSLRWLAWMGFTIEPPLAAGVSLFWRGGKPVEAGDLLASSRLTVSF
jgi:hypothetical protein